MGLTREIFFSWVAIVILNQSEKTTKGFVLVSINFNTYMMIQSILINDPTIQNDKNAN